MKKGKVLGLFTIAAMSMVMMTGCVDAMPELTAEQSDMVAEYAAGLILKYSPKYDYKIVSDEELAAARAAMYVEAETETGEETESEPVQQQEENEQTQQGPVSEEISSEEEQPAETVSSPDTDLAAQLGIDDLIIKYQSFELCDSYPKDNSGFSVDAAKGKKLLILHFDVEGLPESDVDCNLFEENIKMRINVNDARTVSALNTMIPNDITSYMGVIPAGSIVDMVAVAELEAVSGEDISSLMLQVVSNNGNCKVELK